MFVNIENVEISDRKYDDIFNILDYVDISENIMTFSNRAWKGPHLALFHLKN